MKLGCPGMRTFARFLDGREPFIWYALVAVIS